MKLRALFASLVVTLLIGACSTNPVTGRNELLLVSEEWELQVGAQQYAPLRQSQGGDYVVDPGVEAYVRDVGRRLAAKSDRKLPYEFNVINDSTPNAWALPGGKISVNRGLLTELDNEAELAAVLGHEIVHAAAKHGARGQTRGIGLQLAVLTATVAGAREGYGQLAQLGSTVGAQIINSQYGQAAELESDLYGMRYMREAGYDPSGAVELQKTFVRLSEGRRTDFLSGLFASHPPSQLRVKRNTETAAKLPKGGDLGRDRYRQKLARLFKTRKAYADYDAAQAALKKGDAARAKTLVERAIRVEPKEAHFHSLVGDIASGRKDWAGAKRAYDQAIGLNDDFFYYYLQRGKVNEITRNDRAARADFQKSVKLLPTAAAQTALGAYAEKSGNKDQARRLYALAAQSGDADGKRAQAALARLDPPPNQSGTAAGPAAGRMIAVRKGFTKQGTFAFELINQTSRPLANVVLAIRSAPGAPVQQQRVTGVVPAGRTRLVDTGRRLTRQAAARLRVRVLSAEHARR